MTAPWSILRVSSSMLRAEGIDAEVREWLAGAQSWLGWAAGVDNDLNFPAISENTPRTRQSRVVQSQHACMGLSLHRRSAAHLVEASSPKKYPGAFIVDAHWVRPSVRETADGFCAIRPADP